MKELRNILIVSPTGGYAGIDVCLENLVSGIDRNKFNPIVVFPLGSKLKSVFEEQGLKCYQLPLAWWFPIGVSDITWRCGLSHSEKTIEPLVDIIRDNDVKMVLCNTSVNLDGLIAAAICKVPAVMFMHAQFVANIYTDFSEEEKNKVYRIIEGLTYKVVCCSRFLHERMSKIIDNSCVILNGIDTEKFSFIQRKLPQDESLNLVCVGHYNDNKQQHFVIHALACLKKKYPKYINRVTYTMIGPGEEEYLNKLKEIVKKAALEKQVIFEGFSDNIKEKLNEFNCYVNSSKTENLPLSVMEAMAAGLPVLGTINDGTLQLVDEGVSGFLCKNEEEMAEKIKTLLDDPAQIANMSKGAREKIEEDYNLDKFCAQFNDLFEQAIEQGKGGVIDSAIEEVYHYQKTKPVKPHNKFQVLVVYPAAAYASYYLAAQKPLEDLQKKGVLEYTSVTEQTYSDELLEKADIVYCVRYYHQFAADLAEKCIAKTKPFIWFIDDNYFALNFKNKKVIHEKTDNEFYKKMFLLSTAVLVNSGELYHVGNLLESNIYRMPTYQLLNRPKQLTGHNSIRFGFMGTLMRDGDFEIVVPALQRILEEFGDKVELEFIGYCPDELKERANVYEFIADYEEFQSFFAQREWNFGLAPLKETTFNLSKTNNKYREYAGVGIPGIFSNILTYKTSVKNMKNGVLCENTPEDWYKAIKVLIEDPDLCKKLGDAAYNDIKQNYNIDSFSNALANIFTDQLDKVSQTDHAVANVVTNVVATGRPIESHLLVLSRPINRRIYNIVWQSYATRYIGVILAGYQSHIARGTVSLNLYYKNQRIRSSSLPLSEAMFNNWVYFPIDGLYGFSGIKIQVEIVVSSEAYTDQIGVFENRLHRNFWYKLFNKLGLQPRGNQVLYVDFL